MDVEKDLGQAGEMITKDDTVSENAYTDNQLQKEVDELDDALDELAADKKKLQDKQANLKQQIKKLKKEINKQKKMLSRQKNLSVVSVFLLIVITGLLCNVFLSAITGNRDRIESSLSVKKEELLLNHNAKIEKVDESINNLAQHIDELKVQRETLQDNIRKEQIKYQFDRNSEKLSVESTVLTEQNRPELEEYIASLRRHSTMRVEQKMYEGVSYYQVVKRYDLENGYLLSNAGNASIYPGAVLRGDSLMQGTTDYALISQKRNPMTLTCSNGGNSVLLEDVSYGTVTQAVGQLWEEAKAEYSQKWEHNVHFARNEEGLEISLGVSVAGWGGSIGVKDTETKSVMAVTFTETYFSIIAEPQSSSTQYFQEGYDLKNLGDYEPAYVSSVDYGRRIVVVFTTTESERDVSVGINGNIDGVDISGAIDYIKEVSGGDYKICVYGGDTARMLQPIDSKELGGVRGWWDEFLNGGSDPVDAVNEGIVNSVPMVNPVPVSYKLRYLSDNSLVPAVAILDEDIILAENAKLVTITLEKDKDKDAVPGLFRLDNSVDALGYILDKDRIQITKKGETGGEIQFIWDSSRFGSLKGYFKNEQVSFPLTELSTETIHGEAIDSNKGWWITGIGASETEVKIYISDVYEIK